MPVVGLIPFVYAAIKKKRRSSTARADRYAEIAASAAGARGREHARFDGGGAYLSQSCHFAVRPPSPPDELGFTYHDDCAARRTPPESLSRKLSSADLYERLVATGGREDARFDGSGYQLQSCRFAARHWTADEVGVQCDGGSARLAQPEAVPRHLLPPASRDDPLATGETRGRDNARFDGGGYQSQSCRFAVRPLPADELSVSREEGGASRHPPARPEGLSRQLLLPASRKDPFHIGEMRWREREHARLDGGGHQSQSCRFAARPSDAYKFELGFSHDEEYGVASQAPEDLSRKLLLPAGRREREVSRSLRFSSKRVFASVSGA
ncbi:uncharacterized protein [Aegilops tauschii subsp. strangulata]|uniref:Uncharacterized protein n=1 Tax=Aegilops tauschii subsp. strangulata TaxID=200361 RepID=A0A453LCC6_AEGTS|nr:uncharacterized protein LOC109764301 [Aegilops tauschii subsp. strangulata]